MNPITRFLRWLVTPKCPRCGAHSFVVYSSRKGPICRRCGYEAVERKPSETARIRVGTFPSAEGGYIAITENFEANQNPFFDANCATVTAETREIAVVKAAAIHFDAHPDDIIIEGGPDYFEAWIRRET